MILVFGHILVMKKFHFISLVVLFFILSLPAIAQNGNDIKPFYGVVTANGHLSNTHGFSVWDGNLTRNGKYFVFSAGSAGRIWYENEKKAHKGDANAQALLGELYYFGTPPSYPCDYDKAFSWFKKAETAGNARALYCIGLCYVNGLGVEKDMKKGIDYFRRAAYKGFDAAYVNLGIMYDEGNDYIDMDKAEAAELWLMAAKKGNFIGQYLIGLCYKNGDGVNQDMEKFAEWIKKPAKKGFYRSQYELGMYYYSKGEYEKAYKWLKSKNRGYEKASQFISEKYVDGKVKQKKTIEQ